MRSNLFDWSRTNVFKGLKTYVLGGTKTLLLALTLLCGVNETWGNNSVTISGGGLNAISEGKFYKTGTGNHINSITIEGTSGKTLSYNSDGYLNLGSWETGTNSYRLSWKANTGCTISVSKITLRAYSYGTWSTKKAANVTLGDVTTDVRSAGTSAKSDGNYTNVTCSTTSYFTNNQISFSLNRSGFSASNPFCINSITIEYTITPDAPTIKSTTASVSVSLTDENKLDLFANTIAVADAGDFTVSMSGPTFASTGVGGSTIDAHFDGRYFYATAAGKYTYSNPYISAKTDCHEKSGTTTGSVTITVNRLDPNFSMSTGNVNVTTDKSNPKTIDLNTLVNRSGDGAVSYTLLSGPTAKDGTPYTGNCNLSGSTFHAWVGGEYHFKAVLAQTSQYNSATVEDFVVNVNRLNQAIAFLENGDPVSGELWVGGDVLSASAVGAITMTATAGGENVTISNIDGNDIVTINEEPTSLTTTIHAVAAQTDLYNQTTADITLNISPLKKQYITLNQKFTGLKTTDSSKRIKISDYTTIPEDRKSAVTFALSSNAAVLGVSLSHESDGWYLNYSDDAAKDITLTASLAGVTDVYLDAIPVQTMVKVIDPTALCDVNVNLESNVRLQPGNHTYNLTVPNQVTLAIKKVERDWLLSPYNRGLEVKFYNANGQQVGSTQSISPDDAADYQASAGKTKTYSNLDKSITSMVVSTDATKGYDITTCSYTRPEQSATKSATELDFGDFRIGSTTTSKTLPFTVSYTNTPVEITCNNANYTITPSSFGDCEQYSTEPVTVYVTYNARTTLPAGYTNDNVTLYLKDHTGQKDFGSVSLIARTKDREDQHITSTNIAGPYNTTDAITMTAVSDRGLTEFTYAFKTPATDAAIATINGDQLTFIKSGTISGIRIRQEGNKEYLPAELTTGAIMVSKVTPTITTLPTAGNITYGQQLKEAALNGGQATVQNYRGTEGTHNVEGSFAWTEPNAVHTANSGVAKAYQVMWTPTGTDAALYNSATCDVEVLINRANQTITWETETNINFDTPSASVLNATTTGDGSIVYTIDGSSDAGVGTITNNVLTLNKGGKLVINANAAATTNYNAATQVQKTFEVGKRGLTITWENKDEQGNVITTHAAGSGDIGNHFVARDEKTKEVVNLPITITNSDNTSAISIRDNKLYVDCAGTATITAQTATTDQYGAGVGTITLTSQINTPVFTWQIPQPAPNTGYANFFTSSNTETDCILTFTSSNPTLAKVEGGKLIIGGDAQTDTDVTFTVTQTGNCRWEGHTETFTIHVKKPANHVPFTITEDNFNEFKTGGSGAFSWDGGMKVGNGTGGFNYDDKTFILHFSGIPDKLSFSFNCTDNTLGFPITNAEWYIKESVDGQTWSAKNVISSSTSTSEQHLEAPIQLSPTTRYITFCYSGNFAGVFKNINVTELKYFYAALTQTATEHVTSVNMGTYDGVGDFPVKRTIYLRHANAGSDLQITIGDTKNFRLEHNISTGTDQMGDDPITIIYEPEDFGIHNTTLTIHDGQNQDIVITVYAAAQPGATYTFIGTDGDAGKLENWQVGGITPTSLPNAYHTVFVRQPMVISKEMSFYYLDLNVSQYPDAKVTIAPTGGLTIGPSGIRDASADRLIIQSSIEPGKEGQGYLRISPKYAGAMPQVTVQFATRSTLSTGANKDATWQYFGVPGGKGMDFKADYITWLYDWDETRGWVDLKDEQTHHLEPFHGYVITQYGQPTYNFVGEMTTADQDITLTYTPSGMVGDNIFANSYTSPIEVKNFTAEDFEGNVEKTFYLYNAGSWNQWKSNKDSASVSSSSFDDTPGTYYAIPALSAVYLPDQQTTIPSMSGVYVIAHENGAKIHLNYRKHVWNVGMPITDSVAMHRPLRAPQRGEEDIEDEKPFNLPLDTIKVDTTNYIALLSHRAVLHLTSSNSGFDRITLLEKTDDEHFTADYDNGYDAQKIPTAGVANIFTSEFHGNMAISATNKLDGMFIGVAAGSDETYHLTINGVVGDSLYLKDMKNGVETRIMDGMTYSFNMRANEMDDKRFMITQHERKEPSIVTADDQVSSQNAYIWTDPVNLHIENAGIHTLVRLYAADGKLITTTTIDRTAVIPINDLPNSVYMVQIGERIERFIKK